MSIKKFGIVAGLVFALSIVLSPVASACSLDDLSSCDNNGLMALILQLLQGQTQPTTPTTPVVTGIPAGFQFNTNLKLGSTGDDVKYLQIFLNADPATAVGNAGNETSYFGPMTQAAVVKFQNKYASEVLAPYGLSAGTGFFGTSSRAKANAMLSSMGTPTTPGTTLPEGCTSTEGYSPVTGQRCDSGATTPTTPITGNFTVSLAPTSPAAGTLIQGQATADLAHYTFSNGTANPVKVTSVTLNRAGVSADATLANVYLFDGAVRLTDAATVSGGAITYNNPNGIFTIPANTVKTVSVKSDIANTTSGQTVGVSLTSIVTDGTLSSSLPIAGNIHTIASADLAEITIDNVLPTGSPSTDPVSGVRVWEATFTVNQRNVDFTKLALRQINSIDSSDISNFRLLIDGVEVASVPYLDANGYATFNFNKTLVTGSRNVKVLADVTGGSSRYIQMSLRNKADIDVKDSEYGVNISVSPSTATPSRIQVNEGQFTITADNTVLPVTVANNSSNVLIGKWIFRATGEAVRVEKLTGSFLTDSAATSLRNGKIMINGAQAGSTAALKLTGDEGTEYSVNYTFQPGVDTTVELYADIYHASGGAIVTGKYITGEILVGDANATKQVSLETFDFPTTKLTASSLTVSSGEITLNKNATYADQSTSLPQTAYKLGSWNLTAGTAEDLNVNTFEVTIDNGSTGNTFTHADMRQMYLTYKIGSGSEVSTSVVTTPSATNSLSVSFTLPKGQSVAVNLYADLLSGGVDDTHQVKSNLKVKATGAQSGSAIKKDEDGQTITNATGVLSKSIDPSTPVSSLVSQGSTIKVGSYKFEATNDTYTITRLTFDLAAGYPAIQSLRLMDGSTQIGMPVSASDSVVFNLSTPITVSANSTKTIDLEATVSTVGAFAATTGSEIKATLTELIERNSRGESEIVTDLSIPSNSQYAYRSIPTISTLSLPTGILTVGTKTLQKFSISAPSTNPVSWAKLTFTVDKTESVTITGCGVGSCNVKLYDGSTEIPGKMVSSANFAGTATTGTITFVPNVEQQIAGSQTKTYELKATIGGTTTSGNYIMTRIENPSSYAASKKAFANVGSLIYADITTAGTVSAGDVRKTAVDSYAATNTATTAGTIVLTEFANDVPTTVFTSDGTTMSPDVAGWEVTSVTAADGEVTAIVLTHNDGAVVTMTGGVYKDAETLIVTRTAGGYAANTMVATGNSDLGLALTPGVASTASFVWSDVSAQSHSIEKEDWTNDALIKNLPFDTQTLSGTGTAS